MQMRTALVFFLIQAFTLTLAGATFWSTVLELMDKYQRLLDKPSHGRLFNKTEVLGSAFKLKPKEAALAPYIFLGISKGLKSCGQAFSDQRWNCSLQPGSFLRVVASGTREQAFIYSFVSAGVVSEVAKACAQGKLPDHCPCSKNLSTTGRFYQTGCSDNGEYGQWVVQNILQPVMNEGESGRMIHMNAHNTKVGSEFVKQSMTWKCVCEGSFWSCHVRMCRYVVRQLSSIGNQIKVQNEGPSTDVFRSSRTTRNSRIQLVYIKESPDYCVPSQITGSLGTAGRTCNGNCDHLCCSRGAKIESKTEMVKNCRFVWCCRITCEQHPSITTYHLCK